MLSQRKFWAKDPEEGTWTVFNKALWWDGEQKGQRWKDLKAYRAGSSTILGLAYGNTFGSKKVDVGIYILQLLGEKEVEINEDMQLGIDEEHLIRDRHLEELRNKSPEAQVEEIGLVIPLRYPWMNSSPDAIVYDPTEPDSVGLAEYKRTKHMYRPLLPMTHPRWYLRYKDTTLAKNPTQLWSSHYAQIQHHLHVTGLSWCDYCVMANPGTEYNWIQIRIRKNTTFWGVMIQQVMNNLMECQDRIFQQMILPPKVEKPTGWDVDRENIRNAKKAKQLEANSHDGETGSEHDGETGSEHDDDRNNENNGEKDGETGCERDDDREDI